MLFRSEKARKIREAIELNIFSHSEKISNPEKKANIDIQPSKIPDLSISDKSDLNKTISSQNNTEIPSQRVAHVRFTNQPATPVLKERQTEVSAPKQLIKRTASKKSLSSNKNQNFNNSSKKIHNTKSNLNKSSGFLRHIFTILIAGTIGFSLGIITFSKKSKEPVYQIQKKSAPIGSK